MSTCGGHEPDHKTSPPLHSLVESLMLRHQTRREAGAERTLEAVGSSAMGRVRIDTILSPSDTHHRRGTCWSARRFPHWNHCLSSM